MTNCLICVFGNTLNLRNIMGIFDKLFNNNSLKDNKELPWKPLVDIQQLDAIEEASATKPQVIFKHSTRCGISSMVLRQFKKSYTLETDVDLYFLDLLQYRDVSNAIASKFGVHHESPQMIIIKNGAVVAHASHSEINSVDLSTF